MGETSGFMGDISVKIFEQKKKKNKKKKEIIIQTMFKTTRLLETFCLFVCLHSCLFYRHRCCWFLTGRGAQNKILEVKVLFSNDPLT